MLPLGGPRAEKGWAHTDRSLPKASWNAQMHPISALPYPDPSVTEPNFEPPTPNA